MLIVAKAVADASQCTYRCVVLPDWVMMASSKEAMFLSQCTYRCVVLPDRTSGGASPASTSGLNAPTGAWCSLTRRKGQK